MCVDDPNGDLRRPDERSSSGGLLLATAAPDGLVAELGRRGVLAAVVGRVAAGEAGHIDVRV